MSSGLQPVVLELALLPRQQLGPFLILGLHKASDPEQLEANWAERIKWARRGLIRTSLEDINWARDQLRESDRWIHWDACSLNADISNGFLAQMMRDQGCDSPQLNPTWQPMERAMPPDEMGLPADLPSIEEIRQKMVVPSIPPEFPLVTSILKAMLGCDVDPWAMDVSFHRPEDSTGLQSASDNAAPSGGFAPP